MNIAIFTNNYLPNPYGVPNSIESFRKEFEALGHQVYIFAPRWPGYLDENPNVFRYPAINLSYKIKFPLAIPYSQKINRVLEKLDLDIIHSQHPNLLGSAAAHWAKKKNIPLVFTWHTLYDRYTNFVPLIPKKLSANWIIKKAVKYANKANLVVVPTDSVTEIIRGWGVERDIVAISTGVEEKDFQNTQRNFVREKYNISSEETLLLIISRITEEKNIDFIFHSLINILKEESKIKFLVVGNGYLVPKLKKLAVDEKISDKIIFSGIAARDELKDYYAAGDIFVYASKSETQGMVLSEAMYVGLPIVAVAAPGASSLVINNKTGILTKEDKKDFSEAVEKLIKDKELRLKFSEEARKVVREKYTSRVCAKKMLETYEKTIQNFKSKIL